MEGKKLNSLFSWPILITVLALVIVVVALLINPELTGLGGGIIRDTGMPAQQPPSCIEPACLSWAHCGNGQIDVIGEECDQGNLNGKTCASINPNWNGGTLSCQSNCQFNTSNCYTCQNNADCTVGNVCLNHQCVSTENTCGNGTIEPWEECDGTNLNGKTTCNSFDSDYTSGNLGCIPNTDTNGRGCTYNLEACECTTIKAKFRIFPLDGKNGDRDGTQNGTTTQYISEKTVLDATASCAPPDHPITSYRFYPTGSGSFTNSTEPVYTYNYNPTNFPILYSQLVRAINDVPPYYADQTQTNTVRIVQPLAEVSKVSLLNFSVRHYSIFGQTAFLIGTGTFNPNLSTITITKGLAYTDLSNPVGKFLEPHWLITGDQTAGFTDVANNGTALFVSIVDATLASGAGSIRIFNLDSANFRQLGTITPSQIDDLGTNELDVKNNALYVTAGSKIIVFDVTNPSNPQRIRDIPVSRFTGYVKVSGNTLLASDADETTKQVVFYDISNPMNPIERSRINGILETVAEDTIANGNTVLIRQYNGSQSTNTFFDFANLSNPTLINNFPIQYYSGSVAFNSKMAAYITQPSGNIKGKVQLINDWHSANPPNIFLDANNMDGQGILFFHTTPSGKEYLYASTQDSGGLRAFDTQKSYTGQ